MGRRDWVVVGVSVALFVPLVLLVVHVLVYTDAAPGGDQALLQLRVSDVGSSHTPLVGSYQRFGWNQPGPAYLYLLAIAYRLFGSDFAALRVGALIANALAIGGVLLIGYKRGGFALYLWTAVLVAVVMHAMGPAMLASPWEPDVSVLALILLFFVVSDVALGRAWSIPVAAVITTLLVQGWATTAPIAMALFAWALVAFAFGWYAACEDGGSDRAPRERWRRPALIAGGALLVIWTPPFVQELRSNPGNFTLMARFFSQSHKVLGFSDAYRVTSLQLGIRPPWAGAPLPLIPLVPVVNPAAAPAVPIIVVLLLAATVFAALRRNRSLAFAVSAIVAILAEIGALSRLMGDVFVELIQPGWVCGFAPVLAAGWCAYSPLRGTVRRRVAQVALPALTVAVLGFGVANMVQAAHGPPAPSRQDQVAQQLADQGVQIARAAHGPVLIRSTDPGQPGLLGGVGPQLLALELDRAGVDVVVDHDLWNRYGAFRAEPSRAVLELRITHAANPPTGHGWRVVAKVDSLGTRQRERRDRLKAQLDARLGVTHSDTELLIKLGAHPELQKLATQYATLNSNPALALSARTLRPALLR